MRNNGSLDVRLVRGTRFGPSAFAHPQSALGPRRGGGGDPVYTHRAQGLSDDRASVTSARAVRVRAQYGFLGWAARLPPGEDRGEAKGTSQTVRVQLSQAGNMHNGHRMIAKTRPMPLSPSPSPIALLRIQSSGSRHGLRLAPGHFFARWLHPAANSGDLQAHQCPSWGHIVTKSPDYFWGVREHPTRLSHLKAKHHCKHTVI